MTRQTIDPGGRVERPAYDYIVIGAGPAGCAVAARLAQSSAETSVALIEAGPAKASLLSDIPLGPPPCCRCARAEITPIKQSRRRGFGGRKGYQPRGRGSAGRALSTR